jgi:trehalose/maltose hydrolase-like predicted phosphorylase
VLQSAMRAWWALVGLGLLAAGCRHSPPEPPPPAEPDPWIIAANTPPPHGLYLSNGHLGMKVGPAGDARDAEGKPTPLLWSEAYEHQDIKPLPNPLWAALQVNGKPLLPSEGRSYRQELDMRTGVVTTRWTQRCGRAEVQVRAEIVMNLSSARSAALRYTIRTNHTVQAAVRVRDPKPIELSNRMEWLARIDFLDLQTRVNGLAAGTPFEGTVTPEQPLVVERRLGDADFDEIVKRSAKRWGELWKGDIEIEGSVADQQLVRSWLFNLYQSLGSGFLPPMGFSSDVYHGRIFWDQEIWMLPALVPFQPVRVAAMLRARGRNLWRAENNARSKGFPGALYPWEATPWGFEGAPPEYQQEIHINGDILFAAKTAQDWGVPVDQYPRLAQEIARFWAARVQDGRILRVKSPDETADFVDNDLYTNALAAWCLREGASYSPADAANWRRLADELKLPRDPTTGRYLTYDGDEGGPYKQAASLLAIYPLGLPMDRATREQMFDYYKDRIIDTGPAMSEAINAVIAARLGRAQEAVGYFRKSYQGFVSEPGLQFSERRKGTPRTYFLTGAGGALQAVLYGLAGLELVPPNQAGSGGEQGAYMKPLGGGFVLKVEPSLPREWTKLTLKGVHARGEVFDIVITHQGVRLVEGG